MKVFLSPSTQEHNVGAGDYKTEEYRMNQICDVVTNLLRYNNVTVYRNNPTKSLSQAVLESNLFNPDCHIAIHSNAGGARGCEVFYTSEKGKTLADKLYKELEPLTPTADRGIKHTDSLYEVVNTKAVAALIEVDFHDNPDGASFIIGNIEPIGISIARGVCNYLGVKFTLPDNTAGKLYRVQLGAFTDKKNAAKMVTELKKFGYNPIIVEA